MSVPATASTSTLSAKKATAKPKSRSAATKVAKPASSKKSSTGTGLPPYRDLIKEAIAAHPDDARTGISRAQIKKFVEEKYKVEVTPSVNTHINTAIARGAEKGDFVLPKGLNGKVKLNKAKPAAKENVAPASSSKSKEVLKPSKGTQKSTDAKGKTAAKVRASSEIAEIELRIDLALTKQTAKKTATSAKENKPVASKKTNAKITKGTSTKKASATTKPSTTAKAAKVKAAAKVAEKKASSKSKTAPKESKPASKTASKKKVPSSKKA